MQQSMTILMTTHSMEEADALSDTIGIMYMGRLRAIGTSYGLKQAYGKGYKVARRTIAKYRDQLGIPKARLRKEL